MILYHMDKSLFFYRMLDIFSVRSHLFVVIIAVVVIVVVSH